MGRYVIRSKNGHKDSLLKNCLCKSPVNVQRAKTIEKYDTSSFNSKRCENCSEKDPKTFFRLLNSL